MEQLKNLALHIILDAYVTKNAIEHFLEQDWSKFREDLILKSLSSKKLNSKDINYHSEIVDKKIDKYINYLKIELSDINIFLDSRYNIQWTTTCYEKEFFDEYLPKYKRKIEWFNSVDKYPFDHNIFFEMQNNDRSSKNIN